ncbi:biotin-dependent carboxyltransferase family protein [Sediminibacillus albus]|uniref:Antagonist of KipI n=1 Tax=Sediminibacillus albus TaxID=407036 RepID=A0A1G8YKR2_9BACI|nr:biotin-dependent carboxyltransferase family protein [Sediminibacillus albus]SDK02755.1 antagonist of KipI [Sediminibacillus albus]
MALRIIEAGLQTSIQDSGRHGFQSSGFSISGVLDSWAAQLANITVNNRPGEAVLEMSYVGPSITFEADMVIALTGADMAAKIDGRPIALGKPIPVTTGETLQLRTARKGLHCYLSVKGGLNVPSFLGSKSASLKDNLGGDFTGRLRVGDSIPIHTPLKSKPFSWQLSPELFAYINKNEKKIRFLQGRQIDWFSQEAISRFTSTPYKSSPQSNRMGYQLQGLPLTTNKSKDLTTEAAAFGTIQVPPDGQPIVLMAESQPTGGYPKIGQIIQDDLPVLSQAAPGQPILFQTASLAEAQRELVRNKHSLTALRLFTEMKWKEF